MKNYYIKYVCEIHVSYFIFFSKQVEIYSVSCGKNSVPYFYGTKSECRGETSFKEDYFGVETKFI